MSKLQFRIEQVAIAPRNPAAAIKLLNEMGAGDWVKDIVTAHGTVEGERATNVATLAFNYDLVASGPEPGEFEVLHYESGANWTEGFKAPCVSHLGMHCTATELVEWQRFFHNRGIRAIQEVETVSHTNAAIAGKRWYKYVIFDTRAILGVDIKFIVRRDRPGVIQ